jgi:hypothetical protein
MKNKNKLLAMYLIALEEALKNDHINKGFHVDGPDKFIDEQYSDVVDKLLEAKSPYERFFDSVGIYFDAKSHYSNEIDGKDIEEVKNEILKQIVDIRNQENIQ